MGGPLFESIWKCGKCGKEVGRGNFPPANCPFCGVRLVNGVGQGDPRFNNGGNNPPGQPNNPGAMPPGNLPLAPNNPGALPNAPQAPEEQPNPALPPVGVPVLPPNMPIPAAPGDEEPPAADEQPANPDGPANARPPAPHAPRAGRAAATAASSRVPSGVRAFLGFAAMLAALVVIAVAVLAIRNMIQTNQQGGGRGRRPRRLAEEY
jgi:hypothetical protein